MNNQRGKGIANGGRGASSKTERQYYEARDIDAETKFTVYMSHICDSHDYLDVSLAQAKLGIKNLHYLPFFRDALKLNQLISTAVTCYKYSRGIHSYWELNDIILQNINQFQQRGHFATKGSSTSEPCHLTFEGVGIGSLASQRDVANLFKFEIPCDPSLLKKLKAEDVMLAALEGLSHKRFRRAEKDDESEFNDMLKRSLAYKYGCSLSAIGLNVRYRTLFFASGSTEGPNGTQFLSDLSKCEKDTRAMIVTRYAERLAESMSILQTKSNDESRVFSATVVAKVRDDLSVDLGAAQEALKMLLIDAGPDNSFGALFYALQKRQGKFLLLDKMPSNSASEDVVLVSIDGITDLMSKMENTGSKLIMCEKKQDGILTTLAVAFVCYLSLLASEGGNSMKARKKHDPANFRVKSLNTEPNIVVKEIYRLLKEKCMEDVPTSAIRSLERFVTMIVSGADFDLVNMSTLKLNFMSIQKLISTELDVSWKKGGFTVRRDMHIGVLAASVIMNRILIAEPPVREIDDKATLSRILDPAAATAMLEMECSLSAFDPISIVVKVLSSLETDVMETLDVPAVSCLQRGTFLHHLLGEHQTLLKGFSDLLIGKQKWGSSALTVSQPADRVPHEDVVITLASCMKELAAHLTTTRISRDSESFLALLLELEGTVAQRIGSLSFQSATGRSFPDFIAHLVQQRDNCDEQDPMVGVLADFSIAYDSLLASFPALSSGGDEENPGQLEAPHSKADYSLLPDSTSLQSALGLHLRTHVEGEYSLRDFLATSLAVFVSEKECDSLLERHSSSHRPEPSSLLGFVTPRSAPQWSRSVVENGRSRVLQLLKAVPYGVSCSTWCLWKSFGASFDGSLLDFIVTEESAITALRPTVRYLAQSDGTTADCIAVPYGFTDASFIEDAIRNCFQSKDYSGLGAWCLAAELEYVDAPLFKDAIKRSMASELAKHRGLDSLVRFSVETATSMPSSSLPSVFLTLLDVLAAVSETSVGYLQRLVFESYHISGGSRAVRSTLLSLVSAVQHVEACKDLVSFVLNASDCVSSIGQVSMSRLPAKGSMRSTIATSTVTADESSPTDTFAVTPRSSESSRPELTGPEGEDLVNNCRSFVQNLLKSDFNYDSNGCKMEDRPADIKLNKTIENLSNQLYTTKVHFLSEVIQNADDNEYSSAVTPSLSVILSESEIVFHINEKGFSQKDIKSVCSVSESTKEGKKGFIGQKGIGFKSVFAISDCPEIHSNGFHIRFDRSVSMIEPIFIDDQKQHLHSCFNGEGTVLRLPFDQEAEMNIDTTNSKVHLAFDGKLLLYLNKLASMELHDSQSNRWVRHMRRTFAEHPKGTWISLTTEESNYGAIERQQSFWYRKTIEFEPREKRGKYAVDSTKVSIAVCFREKAAENAPSVGCNGSEMLSQENGLEDEVKAIQLVFDSDQPTYPIYAFLPTKIVLFRFVLQGDFILPSNRESCKEDSPWNRDLLEVVPDLFVDLILDVAGSARLSEQPSTNAGVTAAERCLKPPTPHHRIDFTTDNLKALLPRRNTAVPMYTSLIANMYAKLCHEPFLRCSSGICWPSSQLVSTHHLSFDPISLISEEVLFACTGKRYITASEIALDDELMDLLRIARFSTEIISSCAEALSKTASVSVSCLAGLLLALEKLSVASVAAPLRVMKQSLQLVPSQTFGKSRPSVAGKVSGEDKLDAFQKTKKSCIKLRSLAIWPVSAGEGGTDSRVPLDSQVVFVHGQVTPKIQRCFALIPSHRVVFLNDSLLSAADTMVKDGRLVLRKFLLNNFASSAKPSGDWGKSVREVSGGLEELSPRGFVLNVILPLYASIAQQNEEAEGGSEHADPVSEFDRVAASACLAVIYLSEVSVDDTIRRSSFLPTMIPKIKKNSIVHWVPSPRLRPSRLTVSRDLSALAGEAQEVHIGLEFSDSAICRLENQNMKTAISQLSFCIMDPLLGALALDLPEPALQAFLSDQQDPSFALLHSATVTSFRSAKIEQNELKKFQDFLRQFGCVDLFGVYSATGPAGDVTSSTPFLSAMLHKLVQHGDNVITDMGAENELTKSRAAACLPTVSSYLSAYVPHPELQVLHVSVDAFKSLIEVFSLVEREVKAMKLSPTNPPSWLVDLTQRPWCPCVNDDLAADRIRRGLPVQYLVTSPLNILPHSHCHTGLAVHPDIKSAGLFIKAPVGRDFDHLSSLLSWMSRQDRVIASISIMTAMYKTLCSMTDVDAGALTVLRGLLSGGKKFLWIPDSKPRSPTSLEWGALVPLSSVVLLDVSNLLPSSGPVKVLYSHYEAEDMKLLLSRNLQGRGVERVCFVCQAIDGMFGSRGLQWPGSTRGNHLCECKDTGFGRFVPQIPGLVRLTPSLEDVTSVLKYHRDRCRGVSADGRDLEPIMRALESISTNVWKSFYIKRSLHPYSPRDLSTMRQTMLSCDLLPTLSDNGQPSGLFVSASGDMSDLPEDGDDDTDRRVLGDEDTQHNESRTLDKRSRPTSTKKVISVDDLNLFLKLQEHVAGKARSSRIHWIYTGHVGGAADTTELDFDEVTCDLLLLEADVKGMLDLSPSEFSRAATTISPDTFLAPRSTATLFHFLGVTSLSSLFVTEASTAPSKAAQIPLNAPALQHWSPSAFALSTLNSLLEIAQRILFTRGRSDLFQLADRGRLSSILLLQLQDCTYLQRVVRLKPGLLPSEYDGFETCQSLPFQRDRSPEKPLLISKSSSESEVLTMCTELIMKALRIEVALYDQNQNLELMSEIAKCMAKFALNPKERFRFDYVEIEELPDVFSPWVMKTSSSSKPQQAVETIEVEEELAREYLIEDLPHAALEVDKTVLKFIEESKARALKQAVQKEKTVSAEDARVSEANRMRRDVLSDQLAAHMIDCPTAPNMAGPALPDPATEILRYQGMAIARTLDSSQTEDIHRLPGDRASGGVTSSASCAFGRPADSMGGSGSVFNGSESSMHTAGRGDRGIAGSFFQADTQTSALKIPNFEMDFSCALGDDLFQNGSLALMGGVDCAEDVPRIMLTNNADSGRIGEGLAFEYLKIKAVELGFLQAPEWMNSLQESGLPYDIEVLTSGGVTKYCEVKTRSFRENGDREKEHCQWFISLNEVLTAARLDSLFFTLCLSMSVNIDTGKVTPHSASFIGLERGLAHALNNKGASLILQDNRTRLTYLPESQPKASTALDK